MRGARAKKLRRTAYAVTPVGRRIEGYRLVGKTVFCGGVRMVYKTLKKQWSAFKLQEAS